MQRTPEKGEKGDQKASRDKEFAESRKRLEGRIALERALSGWTYVVTRSEIEPLLKSRADMIAVKRESGMPPGLR